jgi:LPXTG-motif cell wall-anchored protein
VNIQTASFGTKVVRALVGLGASASAIGLVVSSPASAIVPTLSLPFAESFTGPTPTDPAWLLGGSATRTGTAAQTITIPGFPGFPGDPVLGIPAIPGTPDQTVVIAPAVPGWLRLTPNTGGLGSAILNTPISTDGELVVDFDYDTVGSGDGLSMFFLDGSTLDPAAGAAGNALGYASGGATQGASNGYVSVGLSEYAQEVRLLGSGNGVVGYNTIATTSQNVLPFSTATYGSPRHVHATLGDGKLTADIEGNGRTARVFDHVNLTDAVGQAALPSTVKLGFAASTGEVTAEHKIRNVAVRVNSGNLRVAPSATRDAVTGELAVSATLTNVSPSGTEPAAELAISSPGVSLSDTWTCSTTGTAACSNTGSGPITGISLPSGASSARVTKTGISSEGGGSATFTVTSLANPSDSWTESLNLSSFPMAYPDYEGDVPVFKNSSGLTIPMSTNWPGLTFSALSALHGTVTASGKNLIYTPAADYTGPDTVTYSATDGPLTNVGLTFALMVSTVAANKAVAMDIQSYSYEEGGTYADTTVTLRNTGNETLQLDSIVLATNATDGTFSCRYDTQHCGTTLDDLTYTGGMLEPGNGLEFFTSSLLAPNTPISVSATVKATGLAPQTKTLNLTFPTATIQPVTTPNNVPVVVPFTLSDPENDEVYFDNWWASDGRVSLMGSTLVYYPPTGMLPDGTGSDVIHLSVTDGTTSRELFVPVTLTAGVLNPPNTAPIAEHYVDYIDSVYDGGWFPKFVAAGPRSAYSLDAWDYESDPTTLVSVSAVHGTATIRPDAGNQWIDYTPTDGFTGWDRITYTFTDGLHDPVRSTISVGVGVHVLDRSLEFRFDNVSPSATLATTSVVQNGARSIPVTFTDVDGDAVTLTSASAQHGMVTASGSTLTYTSAQGYAGEDTISYTFTDGKTGETTATAPLTVLVNTPPAPPANPPTSVIEGQVGVDITFDITGFTDADNDPLTVSLTTEPRHGSVVFVPSNSSQRSGARASTLVGANGVQVIYTPVAGFSGTDAFSYTVSDGNGGSYTQAVTVNVLAAAAAPAATPAPAAPAPAAPARPASGKLPATGGDAGMLLGLATAALLAGLGLLGVSRRKTAR